jgi:hypothetical protein
VQFQAEAHIGAFQVGNSADEIVAKLVAALDARGEVARAKEGGLERDAISSWRGG